MLVGIALLSSCASRLTKRNIQFNYYTTKDYCGGAALDPEVMEDLNKPKPYNGKFYLHRDAAREDKAIVLDFQNGIAKQKGFKTGEYFIFREQKLDEDSIHRAMENPDVDNPNDGMIDPLCLFMISLQPISALSIEPKTRLVADTVHFICNPCMPPRP